ncbi:hypothetical protein ES703_123779 [subsurface metagenome]
MSKLADVPPFKVGAGGKHQVGKLSLTFHVYGLVNDKFQLGALVHLDPSVGVVHGTDVGTTIPPEHFNL